MKPYPPLEREIRSGCRRPSPLSSSPSTSLLPPPHRHEPTRKFYYRFVAVVFKQPHYLHNFVRSTFNTLFVDKVKVLTLLNMKCFIPTVFLRQMRANCSLGRCFFSTGRYDVAIAELNKEMESVFGEPPSPSALGSTSDQVSQEMESVCVQSLLGTASSTSAEVIPHRSVESHQGITHIDRSGQAQMVDVSSKQDSKRVAVAGCRVLLGKKAFNLVASNQTAKGDVLTVAKIAGISGAKETSSLIPLCHNIGLTHVRVDLALNEKDFSVEIEGEAATTGKTGVEMEAMTAVAVAGLTVYDMCKAVSKDIQITELCLQNKTGGKSGSWSRKQ